MIALRIVIQFKFCVELGQLHYDCGGTLEFNYSRKAKFCSILVLLLFCRARETIDFLKRWAGPCDKVWEVVGFNVSLWTSITRTFYKNDLGLI